MFRKYGLLGILLVAFVQLNFFYKIQPFANWYFPLIWLGYILIIDALIYKLKKNSLISNRFNQFLGMAVISALFWFVFEFLNILTKNWNYFGLEGLNVYANLMGTLSFATVLPAFFETVELLRTIHLFDHKKLHKKHKITKHFLHTLMLLGILCFFAPFVIPQLAFPLVWLSFFLLLDPINYLHRQPSIIGHLKDRNLSLPLSLLFAGIIMGFFWEFWNYWAIPKWTYTIPYVGFFKIFEMPLLGYFGYFPFAFELYTMYWFVRSLFVHKEHLLE